MKVVCTVGDNAIENVFFIFLLKVKLKNLNCNTISITFNMPFQSKLL